MKNLYRELDLKNILLVGDDPWTRETLSFFFQIQGCRLESAAGAREGIAALSSDRFDMILCEYSLPDGEGLSFLKFTGNIEPAALKFLIAVSPIRQVSEDAAAAGIHAVIIKPFIIESLEESLKEYFLRTHGSGREEVAAE
ncbi:MAG: response regulator [Deltaproteobacteria bacterium]